MFFIRVVDKFGHQLVKLRYLLLEEDDSKHEQHVKKVNGHKFVLSATRATSRSVCEHCKQLLLGIYKISVNGLKIFYEKKSLAVKYQFLITGNNDDKFRS